MKKSNPKALMPIGVFLVLYLGLGIVFEYVMKIPMGFYNIPIVLAFMVAILVACFQNREVSFDDKLSIMAQGLADKNIITMLLIFLVAGSFVGVVGRSSAESVAYFMLSSPLGLSIPSPLREMMPDVLCWITAATAVTGSRVSPENAGARLSWKDIAN